MLQAWNIEQKRDHFLQMLIRLMHNNYADDDDSHVGRCECFETHTYNNGQWEFIDGEWELIYTEYYKCVERGRPDGRVFNRPTYSCTDSNTRSMCLRPGIEWEPEMLTHFETFPPVPPAGPGPFHTPLCKFTPSP